MFDRNYSFLRRKMGQQRRRYHITDRVDALFGSLLILVNLDKTAFDFDLRAFETEALRVRHATNRDQQHLGFETDVLALRSLATHAHTGFSLLEFVELRIELRLNPAFSKTAFELFRNFFILERHEAWQQLHDR